MRKAFATSLAKSLIKGLQKELAAPSNICYKSKRKRNRMTYKERCEITAAAERVFCSRDHHDPDRFCDEDCPYANLCNDEQLYLSCGVWEESMGEDL